MHFRYCIWVAVAAIVTAADLPPPGPDGKYTLTAPGIRAKVCVHVLSLNSPYTFACRIYLTDHL